MLVVFILVILVTSFGNGFIYDYPCFSPCTCPPAYYMNPTVNCFNLSLTTIPKFDDLQDPFEQYPSSGNFYGQKFINVNLNRIKSVSALAFANLGSLYPGNNFTINLSNNLIANIDNNAFGGLENNTLGLNLHGNLLTTIPVAFLNVANLESLDISNNPLQTLNILTIVKLSPMLKQFFVSLDHFSSMPKAMNILRTKVTGVNGLQQIEMSDELQDNAYIEDLVELFVSNSTIIDASMIPCRFPTLLHLALSGNYHLNADPFANCQRQDNILLNNLEIEWCNLTTFQVSVYKDIRSFSLKGNLFERIPDSLTSLTHVSMLDLSDNKITQIGDQDFQGLTTLNYLYLENNPLTSISDHAFQTNALHSLLLRGTQLTTIPSALLGHAHLSSWQLPDTLQCTCDSMGNLKGWTLRYTYAKCANDQEMSISDYLKNELPQCP